VAFSLLPAGGPVKTKNPPPSGSGFDKSCEYSKPDCRAGKQQRVRKQQVQVAIHARIILRATVPSSSAAENELEKIILILIVMLILE